MMKAAPVATLIMIQPQLLFQFPVVVLNAPAHLEGIDQRLEREVCGQVGQEVFGGLRLADGGYPEFCVS